MNAPYTRSDILSWLGDVHQWPNAETYDPDSLNPSPLLAARLSSLSPILPDWFWKGEPGASILSIGTGKGYFERAYWSTFDRVFIVDPAERTRVSLEYVPLNNAVFLGPSLFRVSHQIRPLPKYGWLGASSHYLFGEHFGWEFMIKLAMMVSHTLVIDGGIFDRETPAGQRLMGYWENSAEYHAAYRLAAFSFEAFQTAINGLWNVKSECETPWIDDGRRTMLLERVLPPVIERSELRSLVPVVEREGFGVYRCEKGYYKQTPWPTHLLVADAVAKVMGWPDFVRFRVHERGNLVGFVTADCGEEMPHNGEVSADLFTSLVLLLLPLGLLPADVARENVRIVHGRPIWIDIDLRAISELDTVTAVWMATNVYKQYEERPQFLAPAIRRAMPVAARLYGRK